ncbi:MAG: DUF6252 family protein [Luteibaculaceae bacterium]
MKLRHITTAFVLLGTMLSFGCRDNSPDVPLEAVFPPRIKFDFQRGDGTDFMAVNTGGIYNGTQLVIFGENLAGDKIEFSLFQPANNNSFTLSRTNNFSSATFTKANGSIIRSIAHPLNNVQLEVLEFSQSTLRFTGLFSGKMYNIDKSDSITFQGGLAERVFFFIELPPPTVTPGMTVSVNNQNLTINQLTAFISGNEIIVSGRNQQTNRQLLMYLPKEITAGTYFFNGQAARPMGQFNMGNNNFFSTSGTLNIIQNNQNNGQLQFNFSFQGTTLNTGETVNISNGSCLVFYPVQPE